MKSYTIKEINTLLNGVLVGDTSQRIDGPEQLEKAKEYIRNLPDITTYIKYKEAIRVLRKVKYH